MGLIMKDLYKRVSYIVSEVVTGVTESILETILLRDFNEIFTEPTALMPYL